MKDFRSILVVVPAKSSQTTLRHLVSNSIILSEWMASEVHFLVEMSETQATETLIGELKGTQASGSPTLVIHSFSSNDSVFKAVEKYACNLIVLVDNSTSDEKKILELSSVPVLILPRNFDFGKTTPQGFLVRLSGERRTNEALSLSLRIADQTGSTVDLLHITTPGNPNPADEGLNTLGDQLHHEYGQMPEKIASEASPFSTVEERGRVRRVLHCTGTVTTEITKLIHESPGVILAVEWNGTLAAGRAATVKDTLQNAQCPILFVKAVQEEKSILRVGRNLRAA